jgi:fucose permease
MNRIATWKGLAIGIGVVLAAALICWISGDTGMASALIVVAIVEGAFHAVLVGFVSSRSKRHVPRAT